MLKNILAPLGTKKKDLTAIQYALALARRISARVFILQLMAFKEKDNIQSQGQDILTDLIAAARSSGLKIYYHAAWGPDEEKIIAQFIVQEHIHILVLGQEWKHPDRLLPENQSFTPAQIILVKQREEDRKVNQK